MLRYDRSNRRPPNYFSRGEQWRVMRLVVGLGLVVLLMGQLRNPGGRRLLELFFNVKDRATPQERAGHVRAAQRGPAATKANAHLAAPDVAGLDGVKDNTTFRQEETGPWYELLGILHNSTPQALQSHAVLDLTALQLLEQPDAYRGRLITLRGKARQSAPADPLAANIRAGEFATLYCYPEIAFAGLALRAYLSAAFLADYHLIVMEQRGTVVPIMVFTLGVPDGFPKGDSFSEEVSVTGYFFKNWLVTTGEDVSIAPVLLAKEVEWQRPQTVQQHRDTTSLDLVFAVGAATLLAAVTTYFLWRRSQSTPRQPAKRASRPTAPDFSSIQVAIPPAADQHGEAT